MSDGCFGWYGGLLRKLPKRIVTMPGRSALPVVLVSAADAAAAAAVIDELMSNEPRERTSSGATAAGQSVHTGPTGHTGQTGQTEQWVLGEAGGRLWTLQNKYYTASVRVLPHTALTPPPPHVEAHLIFLDHHECDEETLVSRMSCLRSASGGGGPAGPRLVAARGSLGDRGARCAAQARYELVELLPPHEDGDGDGDGGWPRVRDALHAHEWPGLVQHHRDTSVTTPLCRDPSSSSDSEYESDEWTWGVVNGSAVVEGEGGEQDALQVALLAASAAHRAGRAVLGAGGGEGGAAREERLHRAERVLAALGAALTPGATPP